MNQDPLTHGLWEASAPPPPSTVRLSVDVQADVAVVGAGFTGLSAALHLALAGARAVVLEANSIGHGASGRNVGLVNAGLWVMPSDLMAKLPAPLGERLLKQLGDAPDLVFDLIDRHAIGCQATRRGTLHCAVGAAGLREITQRAREWAAMGAPVELLDASAAKDRLGASGYAGALLDRRAGTLQPLAYVRGLAAAAIRAGASIHTQSPVVRQEDLGSVWRLATPAGSVTAPAVIIATDAYSVGPWEALRFEQVRLPYFNLATRPLSANLLATVLPDRQGAWDTRQVLSSFRLDDAGRLIIGGVGALRGSGLGVHRAWARRTLARLFPQLGDVGFDHAWYGWIGMTTDALPRLHRLGRECYSISGYNGRGIGPGTTFGRDLARLASGEAAPDDLSLPVSEVTAIRTRGLQEAYYEIGAQIAHAAGAR